MAHHIYKTKEMTMKKILLSLVAAAMSAVATAQPAAGKFSIIPRIGVSLARMSGGGIGSTFSNPDGTAVSMSGGGLRSKAGFTGGVDIDYQVAAQVSVSLGAHYAQQGCGYGNSRADLTTPNSTKKQYIGVSNHTIQLNSLNIPLLVNYYIAPGLAVKTGVQVGIPVSAREKYTYTQYTELDEDNIDVKSPAPVNDDLGNNMKAVDFAVPVGISFEYMNVILDARYNIGLTGAHKEYTDVKNRAFMFTAGYRFTL